MFTLGKDTLAADSNTYDASVEGSEENPIKLTGVHADDFEKLLTVLYTL